MVTHALSLCPASVLITWVAEWRITVGEIRANAKWAGGYFKPAEAEVRRTEKGTPIDRCVQMEPG